MWLNGPSADLFISSNIIRDTTADGLNLHIGWHNVTVKLNSFRNTGDDSVALWSQNTADESVSILFNHIQLPILANGIAIYGGRDNVIMGNIVSDSIQGGGCIHVGNRFGSVPLAGETTISNNELTHCGCKDMNWHFGVGAMWFYALDGNAVMNGHVTVFNNQIRKSPYNSIFILGNQVSNLSFQNMSIDEVGTFVLQLRGISGQPSKEVIGEAIFKNVSASGIDFYPIYNCAGSGENQFFKINDMGGNEDWLKSCNNSAENCPNGTTCQGRFCGHCGFPVTK